jgi:hypothetical protein
MKLALSEMSVVTERRYSLDERVEVGLSGDRRCLAYEFITISRTYGYGQSEEQYAVRGHILKQDGTPDKREEVRDFPLSAPSGPHADLLPDPRKPFIDALWEGTNG